MSAARSISPTTASIATSTTSRKNKAAIIWESEPGEVRTLTYQQLHREVQKFANVLKSLGVKKGDRVAIYMGMTPELPIAMLACARIGAPHTVVFGGFSSNALVDRIHDSQASAVITQDGSYRRGAEVKLFPAVEEALKSCPSVKHVVVYKRTGTAINMQPGRDHWWHELMANASDDCPAEPLDSEHPLYILYTSGTTGKPKGVVHTTGGYSVGTYLTTKWVFDLKEEDTYWCTADIGWVTGHSYIVYGPLQNGATSLMYEGAPNFPEPDRFWSIIERHKVNIFYTAPTAIRTFIKWGDEWPKKHDMSSLRLLGTVGEPINPEAWMWYREVIGGNRCPIVDTWWQTETGHIMITPLPGAIATKPGSATRPVSRRRRRDRHHGRQARARRLRRIPRHQAPVARHAAHHLRRSRPLREEVLVADSRHVLHRRRRAQRQRRLLLDHGPRRRRAQRQRPSPQHHGSRIARWSRTKPSPKPRSSAVPTI